MFSFCRIVLRFVYYKLYRIIQQMRYKISYLFIPPVPVMSTVISPEIYPGRNLFLLQPKVWMKSGGYRVIEPTEALTVVDVNTGKSVNKKNRQEHFLKINLEAAEETAAQLRLRNISGIVIIDFINLEQEEDRNTVMEHLRRCVKVDSVPVQVIDMTKLNLVELTRKKVEKSLAEQLTE